MEQKFLSIKMKKTFCRREKQKLVTGLKCYGIWLVLLLIAVQYTICSILSVQQKLSELQAKTPAGQSGMSSNEIDSAYFELYKQKLWLYNRYDNAKFNTMTLSIDLKNRLVALELQGVVLKSSPIESVKVDGFIRHLSPVFYPGLFGQSTQIDTALCTIVKVPVKVSKAATVSSTPNKLSSDSANESTAHCRFYLKNGVILNLKGMPADKRPDWNGKKFWFIQNIKNGLQKLQQSLLFRVPDYHPVMSLQLQDNDLKAIFRALPDHARICIRQ